MFPKPMLEPGTGELCSNPRVPELLPVTRSGSHVTRCHALAGAVTWARKCGGSCDECHACHEPRGRVIIRGRVSLGSDLSRYSCPTQHYQPQCDLSSTLPRHVVTGPPLGAGPGPSLSALILVTSVCAVLLSSTPSTQVQVKLCELSVMPFKC